MYGSGGGSDGCFSLSFSFFFFFFFFSIFGVVKVVYLQKIKGKKPTEGVGVVESWACGGGRRLKREG